MNTIIIGSILIISIGLILAGLYSTIRVNIKNEENQDRLNDRILSSLPEDFRLKE